jgi:hypothetical protein
LEKHKCLINSETFLDQQLKYVLEESLTRKGGGGEKLQRTEKNKTVRDNGIGKINTMELATNGA